MNCQHVVTAGYCQRCGTPRDYAVRVEPMVVNYHRNGVDGTGFSVVEFDYEGQTLFGIVFPEPGHVAVIDPQDSSSTWRGDTFEAGLRAAIEQ